MAQAANTLEGLSDSHLWMRDEIIGLDWNTSRDACKGDAGQFAPPRLEARSTRA